MKNKYLIILFLVACVAKGFSQSLKETINFIQEKYPLVVNAFDGEESVTIDEYGNVVITHISQFKNFAPTKTRHTFNLKEVKISKYITDDKYLTLHFECTSINCIDFLFTKEGEKSQKTFTEHLEYIPNEKELDKLLKAFIHLKKIIKKELF